MNQINYQLSYKVYKDLLFLVYRVLNEYKNEWIKIKIFLFLLLFYFIFKNYLLLLLFINFLANNLHINIIT